jgi:hypothetical protein
MVRRYDPDPPVPVEVIDTALGNRARSRVQGSARAGTSSCPYAGQPTGRATSASIPFDVVLEESEDAASFLKVI